MTRAEVLLVVFLLAVTGYAAPDSPKEAFVAKADRLFQTEYHFHPWQEKDHIVDGDDWSLPPWVKAAPYSGISISEKKVGDRLPTRIQRSVRVSWRQVEAAEGTFDFSIVRKKILNASGEGKYAVKMGLGASVWETRYFKSIQDRTVVRTTPGTAPLWMQGHGVALVEERPNRSIPFQVVNMDIYSPGYHERYVRMVRAFGESGIPRMKELDLCYLHLRSASRGEEGIGPKPGTAQRQFYEERLRAWAEAFAGVEYKLCNVSHQERDMALALELGMGQRNGFVEHYMLHVPNPMLGQTLDHSGYLVVNETNPLIAENRASGDENEEYTRNHEARFGPIETFPHRYRESTLRMLQMRRNFVWAEGDRWLVNPPLLHYMALELGKSARTAPDAWCYLRESYVPDRANRQWKKAIPVKNFERWVYQRDVDGARTEPAERVNVPEQMFEFHREHLYDYTARKTSVETGQTRMVFGVADAFLSGGPHAVAVKVTYVDRDASVWVLEYHGAQGSWSTRKVVCGSTGKARTVTFILRDAHFPGTGYTGPDLRIRGTTGDAFIRFLRVIKLDADDVDEASPRNR